MREGCARSDRVFSVRVTERTPMQQRQADLQRGGGLRGLQLPRGAGARELALLQPEHARDKSLVHVACVHTLTHINYLEIH